MLLRRRPKRVCQRVPAAKCEMHSSRIITFTRHAYAVRRCGGGLYSGLGVEVYGTWCSSSSAARSAVNSSMLFYGTAKWKATTRVEQ